MKKILSVKEIRRIEAKEFKKRGNSFSSMVDAGHNCAKIIIKFIKKKSIVILCGPGNNGGDGFIIAEYLRRKKYRPKVFCLQKKNYKRDALTALKKLKVRTQNISSFKEIKNSTIVDCLFGTGISRKIYGNLKKIIFKINKSKQKVISIDIPSGVHGDTGKIMGVAIKADITLALHAKKLGHTLDPGKKYCGKITVVDIKISN